MVVILNEYMLQLYKRTRVKGGGVATWYFCCIIWSFKMMELLSHVAGLSAIMKQSNASNLTRKLFA